MTNEQKRKLIDIELEKMALIQCNLGIDSSEQEKKEAKEKCDACEKIIKSIDKDFFQKIEQDNDNPMKPKKK